MAIENVIDIGQAARIMELSHDPVSVSTDAAQGSIFLERSTGFLYRKRSDGDNTDVELLGANSFGTIGFGADYQSEESFGRSTTTSGIYEDKVTLTTPTLTGKFFLMWSAIVDTPSGQGKFRFFDKTNNVVVTPEVIFKPTDEEERAPIGGVSEFEFNSEARELAIQWADNEGGGDEIGIQGAVILIWKVSDELGSSSSG